MTLTLWFFRLEVQQQKRERGHWAELPPQESCAWFPKWQTLNLNTFNKSFSVYIQWMFRFAAPSGEVLTRSVICLNWTCTPEPEDQPALHPSLNWNQRSPITPGFSLHIFSTGLWQGEAERRGPTARQPATRSASLSWCCWANRQWENPAWCCALSKASSMNTRRAPLEVRLYVWFAENNKQKVLVFTSQYVELEENMSLPGQNSCKLVTIFSDVGLVSWGSGRTSSLHLITCLSHDAFTW